MLAHLAIPALAAATPLLAIPAITATSGSAGWSAVAVGMSVGGGAAVFAELAWGLTGPQLVARTPAPQRPRLYLLAGYAKALVLALLAVPAALVAAVLAPDHGVAAAVAALSTTAAALSPAWYFLGTGSPRHVLLADSVPRMVAVVAASGALLLGAPLWVSPLGTLVAGLAAPVLGWRLVDRVPGTSVRVPFAAVRDGIRTQRTAMGARALSAAYIALPTALVGAVNPAAVAGFAAVERLARMALAVMQSVPNMFQGWIGAASGRPQEHRRIRVATLVNLTAGVAGGVLFAVAGPTVAHVVFTGAVSVPPAPAALGGVLITLTAASRAVGGLGLVRLRRVGWILASATVACVMGIPLVLLGASRSGAEGALWALVAAETLVLTVQVVGLTAGLRSVRDAAPATRHGSGYARAVPDVAPSPRARRRVEASVVLGAVLAALLGWAVASDPKLLALVAGAGLAAVLVRPRAGALALVLGMLFVPVTVTITVDDRWPISTLTYLLVGGAAVAAVGRLRRFVQGAPDWGVLLPILPVAVAVAVAVAVSWPGFDAVQAPIRTLALYALIAWHVVAELRRDPGLTHRVVVAVVWGGVAVSLLALYQRLTGTWPVLDAWASAVQYSSRAYGGRPGGTQGHPIVFGAVAVTATALALARRPRWWPIAAGLTTLGVAVSGSRSAFLALLVVAAVHVLARRERGRLVTRGTVGIAVVGVVAALAAAVAAPAAAGDLWRSFLLRLQIGGDVSAGARTLRLQLAWEQITRDPATFLLGAGPGAEQRLLQSARIGDGQAVTLDNFYVSVWLDYGLAAVLALAVPLLVAVVRGRGAGRLVLAVLAVEMAFFYVLTWPAAMAIGILGWALLSSRGAAASSSTAGPASRGAREAAAAGDGQAAGRAAASARPDGLAGEAVVPSPRRAPARVDRRARGAARRSVRSVASSGR
ncbi:O-antigen ligase family protein [uncultured Cellulomonas sp.]|uniref:O-antigen ligase family protein n=1 Tax=uncultured Cellulomonas sp. TaxID=189682 RepID=UPI002604DE29|nr:O-antigen ligase family protein [uncultured Cellulomonas sp.]